MSITDYKNLNSLLTFLIDCISARSTHQIFSIKVECIFLFLNFLIIGLRNFSADCWPDILSFLIPLPAVFFYQKCIDHSSKPTLISYFGFLAILNALSRNILSEAVLLVKSLQSP